MSIKKTIAVFLFIMAILVGGYFYLKTQVIDAVDQELKPKQFLPVDCTFSENNKINALDYEECLKREKEALLKEKAITQESLVFKKIFLRNKDKVVELKYTAQEGKVIIQTEKLNLTYCKGNSLVGYVMIPGSLSLELFSNKFSVLCENDSEKGEVLAFYSDMTDPIVLKEQITLFSKQLKAAKK